METDFQTSEKSLLSDSAANGLFDAAGSRLDDRSRNESDDDLGPETDVDALDEVLAPQGSTDPFAGELWQKSPPEEHNADRLIEFASTEAPSFGDEFAKSVGGTDRSLDSLRENIICEQASETLKTEKPSVNSANPFEISVASNAGLVDFSDAGGNENNKYREEMDSKEDVNGFVNTSLPNAGSAPVGESRAEPIKDREPRVSDAAPAVSDFLASPLAGETPKEDAHEPSTEILSSCDLERPPTEGATETGKVEVGPKLMDHASGADPTGSEPKPEPECLLSRDRVEEYSKAPLDTAELGKFLNLDSADEHSAKKEKEEEEEGLERKSSSALALDGEAKDEIVAESGGEVEDSEDEWNYIKVESGVRVPLAECSDSVPLAGDEKSTVNWSLNPNAAEFIPVAPISTEDESIVNSTPEKAIPLDLADIVASSPNWTNMENVKVPEESAFLNEIKSRPSNIFEAEEPCRVTEGKVQRNEDEKPDANPFLSFDEAVKSNSSANSNADAKTNAADAEEIHGIALAKDMTSSFIDPSTASPGVESSASVLEFPFSPSKKPFVDKKDDFSNDAFGRLVENLEDSRLEKPGSSSESNETLSSAFSKTPDAKTPKQTPVEEPSFLVSGSVAIDLCSPSVPRTRENETLIPDQVVEAPYSTAASSIKVEEVWPHPEMVPEILEKSSPVAIHDNITSKALTASAAIAVGATPIAAATSVAAKKDIKKASPKTVTKTSQKPLATKPLLNGTKNLTAKTTVPSQPSKSPGVTKAGKTISPLPTATKGSAPGLPGANKAVSKPSIPMTFSSNKVQARTKLAAAPPATSKSRPPGKSSVTAAPAPASAPTPAAKFLSSNKSLGNVAPKPKPRVPSAAPDKKPALKLNGDARPAPKRPEPAAKRPTAAPATTPTRLSASTRPATAPAKPISARSSATTARTVSSARPGTATSAVSKTSPVARKSTPAPDKQAKELANRLTSRTSTKTNGSTQPRTATAGSKTARTTAASTTLNAATLPNSENDHKTETKAEKIVDEGLEIIETIQTKNGNPFVDNNKDINQLINPFPCD